jgi:O-antigen/teichoic acid export membrane protein
LIAVHDIGGYVRIEVITKVIQLALIFALAYYFDFKVEVFFACALLLLAVSGGWQFLQLRKHFRDRLSPAFGLYKDGFAQGLRVYLISVLSMLLIRIDVLIVNYILGPEQTGYYSVANKLGDIIPIFPNIIAMILFPKLSALTAQTERWKLVRKTLLAVVVFLIPSLLLAFFLAKPVITFFYGARFLPAATAFQYLVPGVGFIAVHMMMVQFLKSEGFPTRVVLNWLAVLSLNVSLDIWLIPSYGIEAAAAISSLCYFLILVLNMRIIFKMMKSPA